MNTHVLLLRLVSFTFSEIVPSARPRPSCDISFEREISKNLYAIKFDDEEGEGKKTFSTEDENLSSSSIFALSDSVSFARRKILSVKCHCAHTLKNVSAHKSSWSNWFSSHLRILFFPPPSFSFLIILRGGGGASEISRDLDRNPDFPTPRSGLFRERERERENLKKEIRWS